MLNVHVKRLSEQAVIPTKAHQTDAGWDLYCDENVCLDGEPTRVTTGIGLAIPHGYYGQIQGRSGLASSGVVVHPGVIDSGYRGPVEVVMWTLGSDEDGYEFVPGSAIAQLLILPVPEAQMVDVGTRDLPPGERGTKGFGDSDRTRATIQGTFYPGPYDQQFWDKKKEEACPVGSSPILTSESEDDDLDDDEYDDYDSATITVGGVQTKVSVVSFHPDGQGGFTFRPASHAQNVQAGETLARSIGLKGQDASRKPQDAPGQAEVGQKVESPWVSPDSPYGKPLGWDTRPNATPTSLLADMMAMNEAILKDARKPLEQTFQEYRAGKSRVEDQRDFWKAEFTSVCARLNEVQQELRKVRDELGVARTQLGKKDTVPGRIYRAYKESAIKHMDDQDVRIRELEADDQDVRIQELEDELTRVNLRLASDQDSLKKAQAEVSRLNHQMYQDRKSHFRAILDEVMNVVQAIKPRYLEPAQYDVLNAAMDALGKPSPFFGGSRIGKPMG